MFRILCLLFLTALGVNSEEFWDIAVITKQKLDFYQNGKKIYSESASTHFPQFTALTYDAVYNNLWFADSQTLYKYDVTTKKSLVEAKMVYKKIGDIAFDPVKEMLFWTDLVTKSIYWTDFTDIQVKKDGSGNERTDSLFLEMRDDKPFHVAVDSCRGYIYWTNTKITKPTIKKARFDRTGEKVLVENDIVSPVGLAIDQNTKKIYWADHKEGIFYTIESADLDGKNRKTLLNGTDHKPLSFTISKDFIYWVGDLNDHKAIWKLPKNPAEGAQPTNYANLSYLDKAFGIAANYPIRELNGQNECKSLTNLLQNNAHSSKNNSFTVPKDVELFCVHGNKVIGEPVCECQHGYIGERCDISVCDNFCVQGNCNVTTEGQAQCTCWKNFVGDRCEVDVCREYCLNGGECSLNVYNDPVCSCVGDYEGLRCETLKIFTTTPGASTTERAVSDCKRGDEGSTQRPEENLCHNYCLNKGNCSLDQNTPICHCLNNYSGSRCETLDEVDACYNFCLNEGYCYMDLDTTKPVCRCLNNYYGSRCETLKKNTDACYNYCLNGGNCYLDRNMPVCNCLKNYNGSRCEINIDQIQVIMCDSAASNNPQIHNDSAGSATVIVLGVLVGLLGLICAGFIFVRHNIYQRIKNKQPRRPTPY